MRTRAPQTLYLRAPRLSQYCILTQIVSDSRVTQADLSRRCDLSVAMINNYMKDLCNNGFLEYHRKSSKSVSYHLTSAGEAMVAAIEQELVRELIGLFEQAKERVRNLVANQVAGHMGRVVLYGIGPLAELTFHALESAGIRVVGVCDDAAAMIGREWCGREILNPTQIRFIAPDSILITSLARADEISSSLRHLQDRGIRMIRLDGSEGSGAFEPPLSPNPPENPLNAAKQQA